MLFTHGLKFILVYGTVRTKPIIRQVGKRGARGNAIVWVTHFWIIHVVTYNTPILFHDELLFSLLENATLKSSCKKTVQTSN